jgi:hypothetical protein
MKGVEGSDCGIFPEELRKPMKDHRHGSRFRRFKLGTYFICNVKICYKYSKLKFYLFLCICMKVDFFYRFKTFEKGVLKIIFRIKRKGIMRIFRKLCNKELHNLYSSPNINMTKSRRK